jgi:S1-C subfamily serine protease
MGVKLRIQSQSLGRFIDENSRVQFKDKGPHLSPAVALLRADQWEQPVDTNNNQGIFLVFDDGIPMIQHVKTESAAAHAGLQKGDRLRKINGTVVDGLLSRGINTLLSGAPKTTVTLEVIRRGSQLPTEITLVRR